MKTHPATRRFAATFLLVASLALASCAGGAPGDEGSGDGADVESVTFQMNWYWSGSMAGFAVTEGGGLDIESGVNIEFLQGTGSGPAVQLVASGQADMGFSDATVIAQQVAAGAPLVVVATIFQNTPISMEALSESGIEEISDLKGKTVGVPQGSSGSFLFPLFLDRNGITEAELTVANTPFVSLVPALLEGQVDAIVGSVDNTALALDTRGADFNLFYFPDYGMPLVAGSIFTSEKFLEENPEAVRRAVEASLAGWESTMDDPDQVAPIVKTLLPDSVEEATQGETERVIEYMLCSEQGKYFGRAEPEQWQESVDIFLEAGLITEPLDPESYVTYDYLPKESELRPCN